MANTPSTPQISLPSHCPSLLRFLTQLLPLRLSICHSATASVELCSPRGEVPWSFAAVNRRARVSSLAKTHTVSALSADVNDANDLHVKSMQRHKRQFCALFARIRRREWRELSVFFARVEKSEFWRIFAPR